MHYTVGAVCAICIACKCNDLKLIIAVPPTMKTESKKYYSENKI